MSFSEGFFAPLDAGDVRLFDRREHDLDSMDIDLFRRM